MEKMTIKSCCVTGHRDVSRKNMNLVENSLRREILRAIEDGYRNFVSGFSRGTDMIFARLIVEIQKDFHDITLEAALPYPTWMDGRTQEDSALLEKCACVGIHSKAYSPDCFFIRNRFMVNVCDRIIAVYDGRGRGGTVYTMRYARVLNRDIRIIKIRKIQGRDPGVPKP